MGADLEMPRVDAQAIITLMAHNEPMTRDIAFQRPGNQLVDLLAVSTPEDPLRAFILAYLKAAIGPISCCEDISMDFVRKRVAVMQIGLRPPVFCEHTECFPDASVAGGLGSYQDITANLICECHSRT